MSQPNFLKMRRNGSTSLIKQVRGKDSSQSMFSMIISLRDFLLRFSSIPLIITSTLHLKLGSMLHKTSALLEKKSSATIVA